MTISNWHIAKHYSPIFIAKKRPVMTGKNWPMAADQFTVNL
jgi:hypothetical protein